MELKQLQDKYKLSREENNQIYQQIKQVFIGKNSIQNNRCNIIIGQSGAGKSTYSQILKKEDPSLIVIDGDKIRSYHPSSSTIMKEYPKDYCYVILEDWISWRNRLIEDIIKNGYYFNFETSMKEQSIYHRFVKNLQQNNYQFSIMVLATSYIESRLRILERFFSSVAQQETGRLIDALYQQKAIQNIQDNINNFNYPELLSLTFLDSQLTPYVVTPGAKENQKIFDLIYNKSIQETENHLKERLERLLNYYYLYKDNLETNLKNRLDQQLQEILDYFGNPPEIKTRKK